MRRLRRLFPLHARLRYALAGAFALAVLAAMEPVASAFHAETPLIGALPKATVLVLAALAMLTVLFALRAFLWPSGLRTRLISAFLLISLPPICILAILDQQVTADALEKNSRQAMLAAASHTADAVDAFILDMLSTVRTESTIPQFSQYLRLNNAEREGSPEEMAAMGILTSLKRRDQTSITSVALLDLNGRAVADTFGPDIDSDKSNRDYFIHPRDTGLPFASEVEIADHSRQPSLYFSSPVRGTSGDIRGVLRFRYNAAVLQKLLLPGGVSSNQDYSAILLDNEGLRLADSRRPELTLTPVFPVDDEAAALLLKVRRIVLNQAIGLSIGISREELANQGTSFFHTSLYGADSAPTLNVKIRLRSLPWTLVLGYSEAANLARIATQSRYALIVVLCIALAVVIAAVAVTRGVTRPLLTLTDATRALSKGAETVAVTIAPGDEIGELATTFNAMSSALSASRSSLLAANERLQSLLDTLPDTVIVHDAEGAFLEANKSMRNMFGYAPEETTRLTLGAISGGGLTQRDAMRRLIESVDQGSVAFEWTSKRKDGTEFPSFVRLRKLFMPEGVRIMAVVSDITERKRTEQALLKARNYIANIIDSMPSVLIGVDSDGRITQWNIQAEKTTGLMRAAATGQPLEKVMPYLSGEMERIRDAMRRRIPVGDPKRVHTVDGMARYEDVTIYPLVANGVEGAVIRVDDVTERVRLEQMMVQSEKMMSVGGLAAGMAHEINNPLAAILGYAQNMKKRIFQDIPKNLSVAKECGLSLDTMRAYLEKREIPKMLDGIHESGNRAAKIVSNMLSFSRKSGASFADNDLAQILDQSLELICSDYDLKACYDFKKIGITREYAPNLPPVYCEGNQIQQVFLNLFKNAAEAMAEKDYQGGAPRFTLRTSVQAGMAVVEIEDNGPGMDAETVKRAFEPFYTTKPPGKGTGLGLSVSYFIIVDQHGGNMEVFSEPDQWTRFVIKLPIERSEESYASDNTRS
ncbi:MAG: PAS domain S-box protein [Desulfovibrionaceae bacterium]